MSEPKPQWHTPLQPADPQSFDAGIAQAARLAYAEIDQVIRLWPYPNLSIEGLEALQRVLMAAADALNGVQSL